MLRSPLQAERGFRWLPVTVEIHRDLVGFCPSLVEKSTFNG